MWGGSSFSSDDEDERDSSGSRESRDSRGSRGSRGSRCSSSTSLDMVVYPWKNEAEVVQTSYGPIQVNVCGNRSMPGLVTFHDICLNHMTCFQGLFMCSDISSHLLSNFCIYHIDAPGHQADASEFSFLEREFTADDLTEQVAEVIAHYGLRQVICLGVSAGAYILTNLSIKYPSLVGGLILVSPICRAASWSEWATYKMAANVLCFYGMTRAIQETLLQRYFCQEQRGYQGPTSDAVRDFRKELDERIPANMSRYIQAMQSRSDLTEELRKVRCPALLVVGDHSPFREESRHMHAHMDPTCTSWLEVEACGSLVTEERPHMLQAPLEHFLHGLGFNRPPPLAYFELRSPLTSPPSPHFSTEEFSPKACGLKLKRIRTRTDLTDQSGGVC